MSRWFFWKRCRNCILPVQWNLLGTFFERVAISHVSCLLDFIVFGISSKIFGSVVEKSIHKSWETNWIRKVLQKTSEYLIIILLDQQNLGLSGRKISAGAPNFVLMGQVGEFKELLRTILPFFAFLWFSVRVFRTFVKNFFSGRSKRTLREPRIARHSGEKKFSGVARRVFYLSSATSWGCFFGRIALSQLSWILGF